MRFKRQHRGVLIVAPVYPGEALAQAFPPPMRVAGIGRNNYVNDFVEMTALNRGARFLSFFHEDDAMAWLLSDSPPIHSQDSDVA